MLLSPSGSLPNLHVCAYGRPPLQRRFFSPLLASQVSSSCPLAKGRVLEIGSRLAQLPTYSPCVSPHSSFSWPLLERERLETEAKKETTKKKRPQTYLAVVVIRRRDRIERCRATSQQPKYSVAQLGPLGGLVRFVAGWKLGAVSVEVVQVLFNN